VLVFDNGDLSRPFRLAAAFEHGHQSYAEAPIPRWLEPLLKP